MEPQIQNIFLMWTICFDTSYGHNIFHLKYHQTNIYVLLMNDTVCMEHTYSRLRENSLGYERGRNPQDVELVEKQDILGEGWWRTGWLLLDSCASTEDNLDNLKLLSPAGRRSIHHRSQGCHLVTGRFKMLGWAWLSGNWRLLSSAGRRSIHHRSQWSHLVTGRLRCWGGHGWVVTEDF